jgi:hypothetical protein
MNRRARAAPSVVRNPPHIFLLGNRYRDTKQVASGVSFANTYLLYFLFRNSPFHQPVGHSAGLCDLPLLFRPCYFPQLPFPFVKLRSFLSVETFVFFSLGCGCVNKKRIIIRGHLTNRDIEERWGREREREGVCVCLCNLLVPTSDVGIAGLTLVFSPGFCA